MILKTHTSLRKKRKTRSGHLYVTFEKKISNNKRGISLKILPKKDMCERCWFHIISQFLQKCTYVTTQKQRRYVFIDSQMGISNALSLRLRASEMPIFVQITSYVQLLHDVFSIYNKLVFYLSQHALKSEWVFYMEPLSFRPYYTGKVH